jgi:LPXTG-motif cell wall-anchored protein
VFTDGVAKTNLTILASGSTTDPKDPADPKEPTDPTLPKTGDDSNIMLWLLLGGASLTILGGMIIVNDRNRKRYRVVKK